jgi:hypothetical protein
MAKCLKLLANAVVQGAPQGAVAALRCPRLLGGRWGGSAHAPQWCKTEPANRGLQPVDSAAVPRALPVGAARWPVPVSPPPSDPGRRALGRRAIAPSKNGRGFGGRVPPRGAV